jgi:hypothetical protein
MTGRVTPEKLGDLHTKEVQQLGQLAQALEAESSESYEVREARHLWDRFYGLSMALMKNLDRWQTGLGDFERSDVKAIFPDAVAFFGRIDARFEQIRRALNGSSSGNSPHPAYLTVAPDAFRGLPHFDRAAVAVARKELENLEALTASMLECARDLAGGEVPADHIPEHNTSRINEARRGGGGARPRRLCIRHAAAVDLPRTRVADLFLHVHHLFFLLGPR